MYLTEAKSILKKISLLPAKDIFSHVVLTLTGDETMDIPRYLDHIASSETGKVKLLKNLNLTNYQRANSSTKPFSIKIKEPNKASDIIWCIEFDTNILNLKDYLEKYVAVNGGRAVVVCIDPNYGIYRKGKPEQCYRITQKGRAKKSFLFVGAFLDNKQLSATEILKITKYKKISNIYYQCNRINTQFRNYCEEPHDLIVKVSRGIYALNKKYILKEIVKN